jgi:hypothetical protein
MTDVIGQVAGEFHELAPQADFLLRLAQRRVPGIASSGSMRPPGKLIWPA